MVAQFNVLEHHVFIEFGVTHSVASTATRLSELANATHRYWVIELTSHMSLCGAVSKGHVTSRTHCACPVRKRGGKWCVHHGVHKNIAVLSRHNNSCRSQTELHFVCRRASPTSLKLPDRLTTHLVLKNTGVSRSSTTRGVSTMLPVR